MEIWGERIFRPLIENSEILEKFFESTSIPGQVMKNLQFFTYLRRDIVERGYPHRKVVQYVINIISRYQRSKHPEVLYGALQMLHMWVPSYPQTVSLFT